MGSRGDFFWVGNHPALDFVNTLAAGPGGPVELLHSEADLWRWARASPLAGRLRPARRPGARLDPEVRPLRAALHALFSARIAGLPLPRRELGRLNEVLTWRAPAPRLIEVAGRVRFDGAALATNRDLLRALAEAAAELLASTPAHRLRRCAGQGCVLLFLDLSKSGQRRWCSMSGCGNRSKVQAHYRRRTARA
jgi:predicted RNA-binding Zn ribbon-like protein